MKLASNEAACAAGIEAAQQPAHPSRETRGHSGKFVQRSTPQPAASPAADADAQPSGLPSHQPGLLPAAVAVRQPARHPAPCSKWSNLAMTFRPGSLSSNRLGSQSWSALSHRLIGQLLLLPWPRPWVTMKRLSANG